MLTHVVLWDLVSSLYILMFAADFQLGKFGIGLSLFI